MTIRTALLALLIPLLIIGALPAAAAAEEEKKKEEKSTYIGVDTLTAMVIAPNGRHQVMTVQAGVDVPDKALHTRAGQSEPRLRDAYAQALQIYATALRPGSPPDIDYLVDRLQQATDKVLGKPGGKVLIGGMMIN